MLCDRSVRRGGDRDGIGRSAGRAARQAGWGWRRCGDRIGGSCRGAVRSGSVGRRRRPCGGRRGGVIRAGMGDGCCCRYRHRCGLLAGRRRHARFRAAVATAGLSVGSTGAGLAVPCHQRSSPAANRSWRSCDRGDHAIAATKLSRRPTYRGDRGEIVRADRRRSRLTPTRFPKSPRRSGAGRSRSGESQGPQGARPPPPRWHGRQHAPGRGSVATQSGN